MPPEWPPVDICGRSDDKLLPTGLTKREYFAGLAMQGYLANPGAWEEWDRDTKANRAVQMADALLKELANGN